MNYIYRISLLLVTSLSLVLHGSVGGAAEFNTANVGLAQFTPSDNQQANGAATRINSNAVVSVGNFGVKVAGLNVIFPNSDYYQVQLISTQKSAFEGYANPAVPERVAAGIYNIINHTNGARVNKVRISAPQQASISAGSFGVKIDGLKIIFPNTDYYQVQAASTLDEKFEDHANPAVPLVVTAGAYNIINLTTGQRIDGVEIGGSVTGGGGGGGNIGVQLLTPTPDQNTAAVSDVAALSCALSNDTFDVNYRNPVQFGKGPFIVKMKWTNTDGTFPGFPMGTDLKATNGSGAPLGKVKFLGNVGDKRHPTSIYRWTVDTNGSESPVAFSYGELNGGRQCSYSGRSRIYAQNGAEAPAEPTYGSELNDIELQQQSEGVLAFPGALGFGRNAVGGRGGRILTVNTVKDIVNPSDNYLSLREAIEVEKGPRTVVFSVGGVFDTGRENLKIAGKGNQSGSYLTVACQSAPSPGVVIKTFGFNVQLSAHDIIFRHCAVRGIDLNSSGAATAGRGMTIQGGSKNIILDHMSLSWATDEGFQVYVDAKQRVGTDNVTLSNSIIAEGDADSSHPQSAAHADWGYHAMGPSCNNNNSRVRPKGCSIVNNYIAHNASRNGMIWGGTGEISNNIVYNWYGIGVTAQPQSGSDVDAIINNNLMKSGPDTEGATSNPYCGSKQYRCALFLKPNTGSMVARYSIGNNYYIPENQSLSDAQLMQTHVNANSASGQPPFQPATPSPQSIVSMAAQGSRFMKCVGASRPSRDAVDARVIREFYQGTGAVGIGDNVRRGGRHNVTKQRTFELYGAPTSHPANHDKDRDGMADVWEVNYGLSDTDPTDHAGDKDNDGYTNIEEYLAIAASCQ